MCISQRGERARLARRDGPAGGHRVQQRERVVVGTKGGWPSTAAYTVDASENTSDGGPGFSPLATSGAR